MQSLVTKENDEEVETFEALTGLDSAHLAPSLEEEREN